MKVSKINAEHYKWKDVCDGWHYVKSDDMSVIVESMPAKTSEDMHYHEKAHQFFFMLTGTANMILDNAEFSIKAGEGIEVAPMKRHRMKNDSADTIEFIVFSSLKSHNDRVVLYRHFFKPHITYNYTPHTKPKGHTNYVMV